jgi:NADH-quinone oxidoreductase subunit I
VAYKKIERKPLTLGEKLYLPAIASGMALTLKHFFKKSVTMQYPEEKPTLPDGYYRGVPALVKDEDGREKCVACSLCEYICPPKAIRIWPGEIESDVERGPKDFHDVERGPKDFQINMLRCIYCGFCEEVCPEEAIFMTRNYEISGESREELIHDKQKLYEIGGTDAQTGRASGTKKWEGRGKVKTLEHLEGGH